MSWCGARARGGSIFPRRSTAIGFLFTPSGQETESLLDALTLPYGTARISITRWLSSLNEVDRSKTYFLPVGYGRTWMRFTPPVQVSLDCTLPWGLSPLLVDIRRSGSFQENSGQERWPSSIGPCPTHWMLIEADGTLLKCYASPAPETSSIRARRRSSSCGWKIRSYTIQSMSGRSSRSTQVKISNVRQDPYSYLASPYRAGRSVLSRLRSATSSKAREATSCGDSNVSSPKQD